MNITFIVLLAITGFLPADYECRDFFFLNLGLRDHHRLNRLRCDFSYWDVLSPNLSNSASLVTLDSNTCLSSCLKVILGSPAGTCYRSVSETRAPIAEAWLLCPENIKFLSIDRWSLISIWRVSGKLSVLPSGKGVLISYFCEPWQYGHINEGLVIVPMIIYMLKHRDNEEESIYPVAFVLFWMEVLDYP